MKKKTRNFEDEENSGWMLVRSLKKKNCLIPLAFAVVIVVVIAAALIPVFLSTTNSNSASTATITTNSVFSPLATITTSKRRRAILPGNASSFDTKDVDTEVSLVSQKYIKIDRMFQIS